ncbi:uncharacterized protein C8R40DRAFT_1089149 [Lentinula edodes]|uniref:uncharacterized protein n=1 Tax=Lentinula edodes TaxID=5353 RepID=UPI001E8EA10B|nr:uncharacterized protein C8R40DRAFT_1089149 [Lentinula edodes]KAH7879143.1 hypothetical protein C8R40DRAFT_1089149 [Lentinula edodes]
MSLPLHQKKTSNVLILSLGLLFSTLERPSVNDWTPVQNGRQSGHIISFVQGVSVSAGAQIVIDTDDEDWANFVEARHGSSWKTRNVIIYILDMRILLNGFEFEDTSRYVP